MNDIAGASAPDALAQRVREETRRTLQRNIKGLDFLTVGRQTVGAMAYDTVHRDGTAALNHYRPLTDEIYRVPLLIVSPPSNRGYIFDLAKGQSFVEFMLERGYDVFNLDWYEPTRAEAGLGFEDYVDRFIHDSIARVQAITGEREVSLSGYCMGGALAVMYAALYPGEAVRNLIGFATPVDFSHMKLFRAWADKKHFDVDQLVDTLGLIPGNIMLGAFDLARPANRTAGQLQLWTNMWNDDYVRSYRMFDRWSAETLAVPGEYFRQQVKQLIWDNALVENRLEIGGRRVDLKAIDVPILNITAQHDHIVAYEAAQPLLTATASTDCEDIVSKGGHVSVVAGPQAVKRLWPQVDTWLGRRSV